MITDKYYTEKSLFKQLNDDNQIRIFQKSGKAKINQKMSEICETFISDNLKNQIIRINPKAKYPMFSTIEAVYLQPIEHTHVFRTFLRTDTD